MACPHGAVNGTVCLPCLRNRIDRLEHKGIRDAAFIDKCFAVYEQWWAGTTSWQSPELFRVLNAFDSERINKIQTHRRLPGTAKQHVSAS